MSDRLEAPHHGTQRVRPAPGNSPGTASPTRSLTSKRHRDGGSLTGNWWHRARRQPVGDLAGPTGLVAAPPGPNTPHPKMFDPHLSKKSRGRRPRQQGGHTDSRHRSPTPSGDGDPSTQTRGRCSRAPWRLRPSDGGMNQATSVRGPAVVAAILPSSRRASSLPRPPVSLPRARASAHRSSDPRCPARSPPTPGRRRCPLPPPHHRHRTAGGGAGKGVRANGRRLRRIDHRRLSEASRRESMDRGAEKRCCPLKIHLLAAADTREADLTTDVHFLFPSVNRYTPCCYKQIPRAIERFGL